MTIDLAKYGKNRGKKAALMLNIRLQRRGSKPTVEEVIEVLQEILLTEEVPEGWQLAFIDWKRPKKTASGFRRGKLGDFNKLAPVIQAALHSARVSVVRKGKGAAKR